MRAVLDTNVLLRLILSRRAGGVAAAIWSFFQEGLFLPLSSAPLLGELREILRHETLRPAHGMTDAEIETLVSGIRARSISVTGLSGAHSPRLQDRDASDLILLATALEGKADCIVSQDRDLLDLRSFRGIEILDPLAFLQKLRASTVE